jgi:hypothetical protein
MRPSKSMVGCRGVVGCFEEAHERGVESVNKDETI